MKLFIDSSNREKIIIGLDDKQYLTPAVELKSQKLLPFLMECLQKQNLILQDITAIEVAIGPGSFTGLRVGVCVANTLGWVLGVPVNGKMVEKDGPVTPIY